MGPSSQSPYGKATCGDGELEEVRYQIPLNVNGGGHLIMEGNEEEVVANLANVGVITKMLKI